MLLSLGLGALLLLNMLLAQGSFTLHSLDARVSSLVDREQALQQKASELAAPKRLASQAQELGMVPSRNPAFLRADTGKILGVPVPAAAPVQPTPVIGSGDSTSDQDQQSGSPETAGSAESNGSAGTSGDKSSQSDSTGGNGDNTGGKSDDSGGNGGGTDR
jgi:hypothetical protein